MYSIKYIGHGFMAFYLPLNRGMKEIEKVVKLIKEILSFENHEDRNSEQGFIDIF